MIMAIGIMILVSTIMISMLSLSSANSKRMSNTYLYEQAHFLARSGVEYAILAVSGHERDRNNDGNDTDCISSLNMVYPQVSPNSLFDINITIQYIGLGALCNPTDLFITDISTPESNGTMLIDVTVTTSDDLDLAEPIRFHRRTLQKM
jgi:hypothetical protein